MLGAFVYHSFSDTILRRFSPIIASSPRMAPPRRASFPLCVAGAEASRVGARGRSLRHSARVVGRSLRLRSLGEKCAGRASHELNHDVAYAARRPRSARAPRAPAAPLEEQKRVRDAPVCCTCVSGGGDASLCPLAPLRGGCVYPSGDSTLGSVEHLAQPARALSLPRL